MDISSFPNCFYFKSSGCLLGPKSVIETIILNHTCRFLRRLWTFEAIKYHIFPNSFILFRISCMIMKEFRCHSFYTDFGAQSDGCREQPGLGGQLWKSPNACSINPWGPSIFWVIFWFMLLLEGLKLIIFRRLKGQKVFLAERGIAEESGADQWKLKWTWILRILLWPAYQNKIQKHFWHQRCFLYEA